MTTKEIRQEPSIASLSDMPMIESIVNILGFQDRGSFHKWRCSFQVFLVMTMRPWFAVALRNGRAQLLQLLLVLLQKMLLH